mmetsp:Transcript_5197/g.7657  ORF Transcript_5197/g.7657 Transcript_5197/m.7657 type:complete len:80 (-) Transcript_5197:338-577(-)
MSQFREGGGGKGGGAKIRRKRRGGEDTSRRRREGQQERKRSNSKLVCLYGAVTGTSNMDSPSLSPTHGPPLMRLMAHSY